jgi:hypothetical protein
MAASLPGIVRARVYVIHEMQSREAASPWNSYQHISHLKMPVTAMADGAFAFMRRSRNNQPYLAGCWPEFERQKFGWMLMRSCVV